MNSIGRRLRLWLVRPLLWTMAFALLPALVGAGMVRTKIRSLFTPPPAPPAVALPVPPVHDPARPTAVIVLGDGPTEATDFLAPYELLAASGRYNVYAVAHQRTPRPLFPGELDVLPHLSFADYDAHVGAPPDLLVVPFMEKGDSVADETLNAWLGRQWDAHGRAVLLTICGGSYNVARAGLIDGRSATSHQNVLRLVRSEHPEVNWVDGRRYVDDGNFISSAGITAGVDAVLYFLAREFGPPVAAESARRIGYPHLRFIDDASYQPPQQGSLTLLLNGAYVPFTDIGLVLYDGASEIALAALTDTEPRTFAARLRPIAPERRYVPTRHGLHLVPRWGFADAPPLDRLLAMGETTPAEDAALDSWAADRRLQVETEPSEAGYAYDVALRQLAGRSSRGAATQAAHGLEYPIEHLDIATPWPPLGAAATPLLLGLAGLMPFAAARAGWVRRRRTAPRGASIRGEFRTSSSGRPRWRGTADGLPMP